MSQSSDLFWFSKKVGPIEFGFTDARTDLNKVQSREAVAGVFDAVAVTMSQVHGAEVAIANGSTQPEQADALVVTEPGLAGIVRVADCVPVVIVDPAVPIGSLVHAGREGMAKGVVGQAIAELRAKGATELQAWVGPRACGACYEVPAEMAERVGAIEPSAISTSRSGTPALDIGAAVCEQLKREGVQTVDLGGCTIEDERFWSYRRQGDQAGRFGAALVIHSEGTK